MLRLLSSPGCNGLGLRHRVLRPVPLRRIPLTPVRASFGAEVAKPVSSTTVAPLRSLVVEPDERTCSPEALRGAVSLDMEEKVEKVIYSCRFLAFLGVAGSLMGSIICFLKGCTYVLNSFIEHFVNGGGVILMLVEAIDVYLIGTVMLVFGMGLYELFISNLDIVKTSSHGSNLLGLFKLQERPKWLEIKSVNELKTKVGHVIVMVLLVGMFEKSKKVAISSPVDLLCFAASILLCSGCLFLLSKLHTTAKSKHV